jgi:hypothetical protein
MRQADQAAIRIWLDQHGLADVEPTPLLKTRLSVRVLVKVVGSLLIAGFLIGAALTHTLRLKDGVTPSWLPLLLLALLVAGLLVGQWLLGWWVRRVDRKAGAQLSRRVAHPVALGWQAVLGRPLAVFTVATYAAALLLAASVLPIADPGLRNGAIVVLVSLVGAGAGLIMQLSQVLASPAVADDEASLTADVIMRIDDARALVTPALVWSLPPIFLYGASLGWWNVVSLALVVVGGIAFSVIQLRSKDIGTAARRARAAR